MEHPSHASMPALHEPAAMRLSRIAFAITFIALGVLGLVHGDVALVWQHLPVEHLPGERVIAYGFALIELMGGVGLLVPALARPAAVLLAAFLLVWVVLLKLPGVLVMPGLEAAWLGLGEVAVIFAGTWVLMACLWSTPSRGFTGPRGVRAARVVFALALPTIGLSHFVYSTQTVQLVPAWLPWRLGWAYLTGACSIAACVAILLGVKPRLAALLETVMLGVITLLVWIPAVIAAPGDRTPWTALVISAAIAGGAWVVADSYRTLAYVPRSSS